METFAEWHMAVNVNTACIFRKISSFTFYDILNMILMYYFFHNILNPTSKLFFCQQTMSLYDQYLLIANRTVNQLQAFLSRPWLCTGSSHQLITSRPDQLISSRSEQLVVDRAVGLPSDLVFTGMKMF